MTNFYCLTNYLYYLGAMENDDANSLEKIGPTESKESFNDNKLEYEKILNRLKEATSATSDRQLAQILMINRQNIGAARKRKTIPPSWIFDIGQKFGVSLDWLKYGKGHKSPSHVSFQMNRLKKDICNIDTDDDFAKFLNINTKDIIDVKNRNQNIPFAWLIIISKLTTHSLEFLCSCIGEKIASPSENELHDKVLKNEKEINNKHIINVKVLEEILNAIEANLKLLSLEIDNGAMADLISILYEHFMEQEKTTIDQSIVKSFVKIIIGREKRITKKNRSNDKTPI